MEVLKGHTMLQSASAKTRAVRRKRHSIKGVNTRERILGRAAQLFSKHSYADVGMQSLAVACGLSKAALFTHFRSKRQLYVACVSRVFSQVLDAYVPSQAARTPEAKLQHYLEWICPFMAQHRLLCRLTLRMVLDHDIELAKGLLPGSFGRTHEYLTGLLHSIHAGRDIRPLAFYVYSILTLNEELLDFSDVWMPSTAALVGGRKTAAFLEKMIKAW